MKTSGLLTCAAALSTATAALASLFPPRGGTAASCKCFPGDACWPSEAEWSGLNATVGGRLVATVPLGAPCHGPGYDEATCKSLQSQWQDSGIHMASSSSVMAPIFANQSCDAFQPRDRACELGNYVRYAVNASGVEDIQATIAFAREKNVRFVIRNTGHDYLGRSTGAGALAVWTHYLKGMDFLPDFDDGAGYSGKAVKLGAGVQGFEIMAAAHDQGVVVVGGECPTVGIAGGYTQGGGHSALSTSFGLAADNVLSWEVVTADGALLTASKTENSDLYWALSGGGGSTFGVVVSMTVKTYPDAIVSGAKLSFYAADNHNSTETLYAGIQAFHEALPAIVDAGSMVIYFFNSEYFSITPLTIYNKTQEELQDIMKPFESTLKTLGVNYTVAYSQSETYYAHYDKYFGPLPLGNIQVGIAQYGGRLIPRAVTAKMSDTWRFLVEQGVIWIGIALDVSSFGGGGGGVPANSVHPAWRDTLVCATVTLPWSFEAPWSDMLALRDKMTDVLMPAIEAATPGSGSYGNEGDWRQPNFQETFWGTNYARLLAIKEKYDPVNFFYATAGVGSEAWTVAEDGRMCTATGGGKKQQLRDVTKHGMEL